MSFCQKRKKKVQKTGFYLLIERGFKSTQTTKATIGQDKEWGWWTNSSADVPQSASMCVDILWWV